MNSGNVFFPFFSIITPVYNRADSIKHSVQSILDQDFSNWEHVIVDDGSTDGTSDYLDAMKAKENRIKVIHQPNRGVSAARNAGIQIANGQYILFLDSDDAFLPGAFSFLYGQILKNSSIDMIIYESNRMESLLDNDYLLRKKEIRETFLPGLIGAEPHQANRNYRPIVCNKCVRRLLITYNHITFDEKKRTWEDGEFAIKLVDKCNTILLTREKIIRERTIEHDDHLSYSYYSGGAQDTIRMYEWIKGYFGGEYNLESEFFWDYHFNLIQLWLWRTISKDKNPRSVMMPVLQNENFVNMIIKRTAKGVFEQLIQKMLKNHMFNLAYFIYWLQNAKNKGKCF